MNLDECVHNLPCENRIRDAITRTCHNEGTDWDEIALHPHLKAEYAGLIKVFLTRCCARLILQTVCLKSPILDSLSICVEEIQNRLGSVVS